MLESASVLARVILGSAQEEIGLTRLQRQVQDQVAAMAAQVRLTTTGWPHAWGLSSSRPAPVIDRSRERVALTVLTCCRGWVCRVGRRRSWSATGTASCRREAW